MSVFKTTSPWYEWADTYLFYLRALNPEHTVIEVVREKPKDIHRDPEGETAYRHEVLFIDEYISANAESTLNEILSVAGYKNLQDFRETNGEESETGLNLQLAALIAEHRADLYALPYDASSDIIMSREEAVKQVHKVIGWCQTNAKVRHALCRDCDRCEDGSYCTARGLAIEPDMRAFDADCGRFLFDGMGECYCVRSKSEETPYNEPLAYIVTEEDIDCSEMSTELRKQNLLNLRASSFQLLEFYPWNFRTKDFANTPRDEDAADKIYATCLLFRKVDEALQRYGTDILSVDLNEETGMYDINLCFGSSSDCYAAGVASQDAVLRAVLINGLDTRHVGYVL